MSGALTDEMRELLKEAVGPDFVVLGACIAQMFIANPNPKLGKFIPSSSILTHFSNMRKNEWTYTKLTGALTFVVNKYSSAYYFQMVDLRSYKLKFAHELYEDLNYQELTAQFHAFEMDDCICGFNINRVEEAKKFHEKVTKLAPKRKKQKLTKKGKLQRPVATPLVGTPGSMGPTLAGMGFDMNNLSPEWKQLLRNAGIRKKDLHHPEVQQLILSVMEEQGYSTHAPPQISMQEASQVYDAEAYQAYEEYQREVQQYEEELDRYHQELAEYSEWEVQQDALSRWEDDNHTMVSFRNETLKRVKGITKEQLAKDEEASRLAAALASIPPPLPDRKPNKPRAQAPKAPAPPALPRLPPLPTMDDDPPPPPFDEEDGFSFTQALPAPVAPPRTSRNGKSNSRVRSRSRSNGHRGSDSSNRNNSRQIRELPPTPKPVRRSRSVSKGSDSSNTYNSRKRRELPPTPKPVKPKPKPKSPETLNREKRERVLGNLAKGGPGKRAGVGSVMLSGVKLKAAPKVERQPSQHNQMLLGVKGGINKLRHVSVLPTIKNLKQDKQESLLGALKDKLSAIRGATGGDDSDNDSDDDSDW
uniref:WH1 domain-containing protein n=1 Tax=Aplanochytrium stocchinoi TaxID=215587 RepID=A0A7S3UYB7_9STRA|mmetsp:Transcript_11972/g.13921  ORF Transcript_11972/g.13921 Transcript_11972/m.13921 type:complete len:587 (-) Transcript_11972:1595-3355(-)|eukprot:CAMPEP_0204840598 /NCGR_PEP_ID=MMETSP1346-20131115/38302_1 /ASSEMBLY_ACC=CAM_ASM_000771 /TAXON_ID=215587 /ORGANISM="Aplanochytrium stocchinoi, Strain GSBS06" /LENGTH=586 /DNA_ID=CAMNT_0051978109 /DNA_START=109 /DNA_END=1866 /DNA_ORIENTATION=+